MWNTPIQQIEKNLYVKREDLIPYSFGGNKARKAFYFFHMIDSGDYNCVVTYGSSSSNHCRVIANMAAARNLLCYIIGPEEASEETFNSRMMKMFGAKIHIVPVDMVHDTIEKKMHALKESGERPYFIPGGGHGNLGTQAYVDCYQEILSYEKKHRIKFDYIFFASGTGTTQAGLVCGELMYGNGKKIVGISIARKGSRGRQIVVNSVYEYLREKNYSCAPQLIDEKICFIDEYIEGGYGKKNLNVENTIKRMLVHYGIPMDSTYTGKAYAGMTDYLHKNGIQDKNILFIHTGGTPLFFDDMYSMV
mgnify:FL=1